MDTLPVLETERLILRQFEQSDQRALCAVLGDRQVTATLLEIPYPFEMSDADFWIRAGFAGIAMDHLYPFAIVRREDCQLLGCIDIELTPEHRRGDIAYWIGSAYWRQGYTSEAARRIVRFGFEDLNLNRIYAQCLTYNHASAGVMKKAGMTYEATLRQSTLKDGQFKDMAVYGVTRADYDQRR